MFPPQSTPSKRPKRRVESYRIYKRPYSACSQSSRPSPSSYEKATHGRLVGPTLSTPRGDNNYNQYRPLCEVCPRDRDKVVGTLQGNNSLVLQPEYQDKILNAIKETVDINKNANPNTLWEIIKGGIRNETIKYASFKKKEHNKKEIQLSEINKI